MMEPVYSRIAFLRERVEARERAANRTTFGVPFRQRQVELVKIEVPIEFPLYNVQSGRTHLKQTEWIEQNNKPKDFFADPEDDEVQRVQHELLLALIDEQGLAQDLQRRDQLNPIVLSHDGFIVDGNRRIAALRAKGDVENAVAVVLPSDTTRSEAFETELELQMARETRAEYNWIDQALHIRYGVRDLGEQVDEVARRMNVPQADIEAILQRLALVDQYLEWLGTPEAYHRVPPESEQSFIELAQRDGRTQFRSLPAPLRRAYRLGCFGVIQSEDGGYMDVRRVADSIRSHPTEVASRARDRLPEALADPLDDSVDAPPGSTNEGDVLAQLASAEGQETVTAGAEVLNIVADHEDARHSTPILIDIARELDEEQRDAQTHLEPLRKVERALRLLRDVRIGAETRRLDDVAARLNEVITEAERLAGEVGHHSSDHN